ANGKRLLDYVLSFGAGSGPPGRVRRPSRASDRGWRRPLPVTGTRGEDLRGRGETAYSVNRVRQCCTRRPDVSEPAVPGGAGTPKGRCGARRAHCGGGWLSRCRRLTSARSCRAPVGEELRCLAGRPF